eukprot:gene11076-13551_t
MTMLSLADTDGDPIAYLKSLAGDTDGQEILAIAIDILNSGYVHLDAGTPDELYVWPYFFAYPLDKLDAKQRVELFQIVTAGDYDEMKQFGTYVFYRLGITPKGRWRFFVNARGRDPEHAPEHGNEGAYIVVADIKRNRCDRLPRCQQFQRPHQPGALAPLGKGETRFNHEFARHRPGGNTRPVSPILGLSFVEQIAGKGMGDARQPRIRRHRQPEILMRQAGDLIENDARNPLLSLIKHLALPAGRPADRLAQQAGTAQGAGNGGEHRAFRFRHVDTPAEIGPVRLQRMLVIRRYPHRVDGGNDPLPRFRSNRQQTGARPQQLAARMGVDGNEPWNTSLLLARNDDRAFGRHGLFRGDEIAHFGLNAVFIGMDTIAAPMRHG